MHQVSQAHHFISAVAVDRAEGKRHDPIWEHQPLPLDTMAPFVAVVEVLLVDTRTRRALVAAVHKHETSLGRWHSAHLDGEKVPQPRPRARPGPPTKHSAMQMPPLHHPQNTARRSSCCESCGCYGCCRCWRHSSDAAYCCSSGGERHDHSKLRACGESIGGRPRATRHAFLLHGPFASEPASEASSEASSEVRPKSL
jgi:hypothetical protein